MKRGAELQFRIINQKVAGTFMSETKKKIKVKVTSDSFNFFEVGSVADIDKIYLINQTK